jgi:lysophospholipase L1-like esterase
MSRSRILILALALVLLAPSAAQAAKPKRQLYVSLGDSYATGFQPDPDGRGANTRNGFAYQVPRLAAQRGYRFKLVNFGCGGETTESLLHRTRRCSAKVPGGRHYAGRTQIAAAVRFLRAHRKRVRLITVSIGGNDVTRCARTADPIPCVAAGVQAIDANVTEIAKRLRKAAGSKAGIVGITYPNVILGQWVGENADQELPKLSVVAFKDLINPALRRAYEAAGGKFVDVTAATGAYGSFDKLVALPSGALVPKPVAEICRLTFYCQLRDIHARTSGYGLIAKLVAKTLPVRSHR